jgi:FAD/FMN-containing dehydrogenase
VTSFEFEVDEVGQVGWAQLAFQVDDMAAFLEGYGSIVESAPRDLTVFLLAGGPRPGQPQVVQLYGLVDSDDPDTIIARLQPFAELAPLVQQSVQLTPYAQVMANADLGPQHGSGEPHSRSGLIEHVTPAFAETAAAMLASGAIPFFQLRAVGGAVSDVAEDATAYAHRSANFSVVALGSDPARLDAQWRVLAEHTAGMYLSFDSSLRPERIAEAFPPATLERLRAIKAAYDPTCVFRDNFAIEPAESADAA